MRGHLTDGEMAAQIAGTLAGEGQAHLQSCAACRKEWERLESSLVGLAAHVQTEAAQPEAFYQAQRAKIASRRKERRPVLWCWRRVWAPALAAAAAGVAFVLWGGLTPQTSPDPEADEALLYAVHNAIRAEVPTALRPAALLLAEFEQGIPRATVRAVGANPKGDQP